MPQNTRTRNCAPFFHTKRLGWIWSSVVERTLVWNRAGGPAVKTWPWRCVTVGKTLLVRVWFPHLSTRYSLSMKLFVAVILWVIFWACVNFGGILARQCEVLLHGQLWADVPCAVYGTDVDLEARGGGRKSGRDVTATWTRHLRPWSVFWNVGEGSCRQEAWRELCSVIFRCFACLSYSKHWLS